MEQKLQNSNFKGFPTLHPHVKNSDGSESNVLLSSFGIGDKQYVIPTMVNGKKLSPSDAVKTAKQHGLEKYPSFQSHQEADNWAKSYHSKIDKNGQINNTSYGYPVISAKDAGLDSYFKKNPNVAGMAWGAGENGSNINDPRSLVVNEYNQYMKDQQKKDGLLKLEAARHVMSEMQYVPDFKITKEQRDWQKTLGAYQNNDNAFKQSLISRILVGENVPGVTPEQKISAMVVEKELSQRFKQ